MNIITIFSGSHKPTASSIVEYKGTFEIAKDFVLRRDLMQLRTSEITIIDKDNIIRQQDIILFSYKGKNRFGKIFDIERNYDTTKLYFTYGMDSHQMEIPQNLLAHQFSNIRDFDNRQDLVVEFQKFGDGSRKVTVPDGIISVDVAIRQLVRRSYFEEQYRIIKDVNGDITRFKIRVTDENVGGYQTPVSIPLSELNIRLDDPFIQKSYLLKIGSDKMTRLRLYNQDDITFYEDYQLLNDGSIVTDTTTLTIPWDKEFSYETLINVNSVTPQRMFMKQVAFDVYNNLDYAKDLFYQNEYDNEIEIEVSESNPYFKLYTDDLGWSEVGSPVYDTLLGRPANVYLPNSSVFVKTVVSGYEISYGVMKIIFGLSRSRLTDIINNFVNNDNV